MIVENLLEELEEFNDCTGQEECMGRDFLDFTDPPCASIFGHSSHEKRRHCFSCKKLLTLIAERRTR